MFAGVRALMQAHRPTIMVVGGVCGVVGAGIWACKVTVKAQEIKINMDADLEAIKESGHTNEKLYKACIRKAYFTNGLAFAKVYGPPVLLGVASLWSILYGHKILCKENLALAGAYGLLTMDFDKYRGRVVERLGDEIEQSIHYGMGTITAEDAQGHEVTVEFVPEEYANMATDRSVFFDESSIYWNDDPEENKLFLIRLQERAQKKFDEDGYLFLSWVYKNLDVPVTYASNVCGWVKGWGEEEINFGIFDIYSAASRRFVNGIEPVVLLNFNDHGYIADKI